MAPGTVAKTLSSYAPKSEPRRSNVCGSVGSESPPEQPSVRTPLGRLSRSLRAERRRFLRLHALCNCGSGHPHEQTPHDTHDTNDTVREQVPPPVTLARM